MRAKGLVMNPQGERPLAGNVCGMGYLRNGAERSGLRSCVSEYVQMDGRFEHGDESSSSSFIGTFLVNKVKFLQS